MLLSRIDIHKPCMVVLLEPQISGIKAELLICFLKFHHSYRVEALGYSGGIWILWNDNWSVWILINHKQYVHLNVWDDCRCNFLFIVIYGNPQARSRMKLWRDLTNIAVNVRGPWVVASDFNAILCKDENVGALDKL